jgi:hypothetical protein
VSLLLAAHADVNKATTNNGTTPLYAACHFGYAPVVSLLLAAHADVNKARTDDGATPLYIACQNGHAPVVSLLLAAHADVNKARTYDGTTPLHAACRNGHVEVAFPLLIAGADLTCRSHSGRTPLDVAWSGEVRTAVQDMLPSRADAVEALRGIFEATGMIPHVAQCAVYHRYVCRPSMHDSLAEEFISNLRSGAYTAPADVLAAGAVEPPGAGAGGGGGGDDEDTGGSEDGAIAQRPGPR